MSFYFININGNIPMQLAKKGVIMILPYLPSLNILCVADMTPSKTDKLK